MTSAPDAPDPHTFSDDAIRQLHAALAEMVDGNSTSNEARLRDAMERLAAEAHALVLGFEKVLSVVKEAWIDVTADWDISFDQERGALDRAVNACIEAYYHEAH